MGDRLVIMYGARARTLHQNCAIALYRWRQNRGRRTILQDVRCTMLRVQLVVLLLLDPLLLLLMVLLLLPGLLPLL